MKNTACVLYLIMYHRFYELVNNRIITMSYLIIHHPSGTDEFLGNEDDYAKYMQDTGKAKAKPGTVESDMMKDYNMYRGIKENGYDY